MKYPSILNALNPFHAALFIFNNKLVSFFALSNVILCATGGEALYADMGHLKRRPITQAWVFVFICLILNYMGQGAFFILNPGATNILFGMAYHQAGFLYLPFLILSIFATVIASQAMISGIFSVVYQGITTRILPIFKVDYKSDKVKGQIYVDFINWFLLVTILIVMAIFQSSENLAAAYGVAVAGNMVVTSILMVLIFFNRKNFFRFVISIFLMLIDFAFVTSTMLKIHSGGYCSIILAGIPLTIILIYTLGQKRLFFKLNPYPLKEFLMYYNDAYAKLNKIKGSCIFMIKDVNHIPPYIVHTILKNEIIYEDNILLSINRTENPWEVGWRFKREVAPGLRYFEITLGYMEIAYIEAILRSANIKEKAIFYGLEEISAHRMPWKIFAFIKKLAPSYVYFYKFPPSKLHGVVTRVRM
jgi:KUP system potassium uptake protein